MEKYEIYKDIKNRCGGNIYIGVVGPVRTGKSTFIKSFMDRLILPNIADENERKRTTDELPQSGSGKIITTTEPKFIPGEAVKVKLDENTDFSVRMIDCVGYMAEGAAGHMDGENPRMVSTPWSKEKIPFEDAAEIGPKKVINDHSSIGIVVTTDGSVTDLPREAYVKAEKRVISELNSINKPFVILLNTSAPNSVETEDLRSKMEEEYGAAVISVDCMNMNTGEIEDILRNVLYEFPVDEISFNLPGWIEALPNDNSLKAGLIETVLEAFKDIKKLKDIAPLMSEVLNNENVKKCYMEKMSLSEGTALIDISVLDNLFYNVLSETTGTEITSDSQLISIIKELSEDKREYDKIKNALREADAKSYGTVIPGIEETALEEPELIKQGGSYGIKVKAKADSFHIIKAPVVTEVSPVVGSEEQSRELLNYLKSQFENDRDKIWNCNIFGKTLADLVSDGFNGKLNNMPEDAQQKLCKTVERIVNRGNGRLICILL
ncbi:MAG: stage IV sporulation protein A [Clostridiales bacterium]|nr:stage IV sporulation protein A [Clostridiales bacterium]